MTTKTTASDRLPGDLDREQLVARMIRVDQAGEYGAARIYEGQLAILGRGPSGPAIRAMAEVKGTDAQKRIVTVQTDCFNQDGEPVVKGEAVILLDPLS